MNTEPTAATTKAVDDPAPAVEIGGLSKHFGAATALDRIDFTVPAGQFLTIFGPNGAGKTTLMRIIATLARASEGSVRIFGRDVHADGPGVRRRIGLVTHRSLLYPSLSALENVAFFARMFGVDDGRDRARETLVAMGLEHRMSDAVQTYSRGMEQRCAIARALVHRPDILLLDEPFSALDPAATARLRGLLVPPSGSTRTIVLTSHDLGRGADLADRVAILARGRIAFDARTAEIAPGSMRELYDEATRSRGV